jgi:protease-4
LQPFTPEQRDELHRNLEAFYERFVGRVAEGRQLPREAVDQIARGRVWSGRRALEVGLVDSLGTLDDALGVAKELAGLSPDAHVPVDTYQEQPGFLDRALANVLRNASILEHPARASMPRELAPAWDALCSITAAFDGSPQFRLPWTLRID